MSMLISHVPTWMTKGLFKRLGEWKPWASDDSISDQGLDLEFFGNRSGTKESSPLVENMTRFNASPEFTDVQWERIDSVLCSLFRESWSRLWYALSLEYNPIENYGASEEEHTGTDMKTAVKTDMKTERNRDSSDKGKVLPLNQSTPVTIAQTDSTAQASSNYDAVSGSDATNFSHTTGDPDENVRTLERHGNIGVTTTQQMLESEYELRKKSFFDAVFADVDRILTIPYWRC